MSELMEPRLPLDAPRQPNPPPRPRRSDPKVVRATALAALDEVIRWLADDYRESDRDEIIADLEQAISEGDDGYSRCRILEAWGWTSCDSELVEILDGCDGSNEHRAAVAEWVAANGIIATLEIGATVTIPARFDDARGMIVAIDAKHATYTIATQRWLRSHPDQLWRASGWIISFEDVEREATQRCSLPTTSPHW